jgi:DNA polymerase I
LTCASCRGAGAAEHFAFNLASPKQLADVLYNGLKLPKRSRKGKVTTDEEALKSLLSYDKSGFVAGALRFAKLSTMREIYERLEPDSTGRVHTVFNIAGAYTGRFSSSGAFYVPHSTNLQNLPAQEAARDPLFRVRDCFVPESGCVFVYADLSQAEARVSAALSGDIDLLDRWSDPRWDAHRWTASQIFNKPEALITEAERFLGKKCRHALNYGMGYNKFWREVNDVADLTGVSISQTQAKEIVKGYHALHPNLDEVWWNRVQQQVQTHGYMEAQHCGWRANFWPRYDEQGVIDAETLRAAIAWEPQHTIVHLLNEGMLEIYAREREYGHKLLLQGHDSVLLSVPKMRWRAVARLCRTVLERPMIINGYNLLVPVDVSMSETNWSALKKVKL